jgi:hypothetical protein
MDYEFDIVFDLDLNHNAMSSKDRSSLFDGKIVSKPDEKVGKILLDWLNRGGQPPAAGANGGGVTENTPAVGGRKLAGQLLSKPADSAKPRPSIGAGTSAKKVQLVRLVSAPVKAAQEGGEAPLESPRPPLFDEDGRLLGEKETTAMLTVIAEAKTEERLLSIEQSRLKGVKQNRLTPEQAERLGEALHQRRAELSFSIKSNVA